MAQGAGLRANLKQWYSVKTLSNSVVKKLLKKYENKSGKDLR